MKRQIESITLQNDKGQRLRIYVVDGSNTFCIGMEGDNERFEFAARDADEINKAIDVVVDSFA